MKRFALLILLVSLLGCGSGTDEEVLEVELIHMTFSRPYVPEPHRVAAFIKDQLAKIGVKVKLTGYDKTAYTDMTKSDDHPMYLLGWNADYPDPDNFFYPLLHGDNAGDLNGSHFNDPEFNQTVTAAQSELDPDKRAELYKKAYARYREMLPTVPLVHVKQLVAHSSKLTYNMHPIETRFNMANFGEAMIWSRSADSSTLDPAAVEWGEDAKVTQNIYEPLVTFGEDTVTIVGGLADNWTFSEDGKTLSFHLRKGVKFHDGTDFNSAAVEFTYERLLNPNFEHKPKVAPYAPMWSNIAKVKADGDHKVVFTLKEKSAVILYQIALFGAGIVSPTAVKKHGDKFPANPVGTGPFKFTRWDRDVKITLDRFDGYWGKKPNVAQVIVVPTQSPQTAIQKLKLGEVHVVDNPTLADIKPLQDDDKTDVNFEGSLNTLYLGFNMKQHPYSDPNFRKAVALALDRNMLNKLAYYNLAQPANNVVPPIIWGDISEPEDYEYNIEKAKELLKKVKKE